MSPSDVIRKQLDERGIDYQMHDGGNRVCFYFDYCEQCGDFLKSIDVIGACVIASQSYLTPEQAIAATVGTEPDEATMLKLHERMNAALLDMQEELLAYHPQDCENASSKELIDCVIRAHQIIEDAATAGVGTCQIETTESWLPAERYHRCKHCGAFFAVLNASHDIPPRVCPNCGRRIIEEVTE